MKKSIIILLLALGLSANSQTTQISALYCGYTATSTIEFIWADSLGLPSTTSNDRYTFKLQDGVNTLTWTTNNQWPIMQWNLISGFTYNTTYTASVAWSSDNGATFGAYGSTCTVISPSFPTTSLQPVFCGYTAPNYSSLMTAVSSSGTKFRFLLENLSLGYSQTFTNVAHPNVSMAQYTGLVNNTTYSMSVGVFYNGAWGSYGNICQVTTPSSLPTTSVVPANCSYTPASYSELLYVGTVNGHTGYGYQLSNSSLGYSQTFTSTTQNFNLSEFAGLTNGTTYTIQAQVQIAGVWGPFGPGCNLTTPSSAPTTSIVLANCGYTPPHYSTLMYVGTVAGHTGYGYRLTNASLGYVGTFTSTNQNFNFSAFGTGLSALPLSTTYTVDARVQVNGVWGPYGPVCQVTTPAALRPAGPYPNPSSTHFTTEYPVIVMDVYGKEIERIETGDFGHDYPKGLYYVKIGEENYKLIKQ